MNIEKDVENLKEAIKYYKEMEEEIFQLKEFAKEETMRANENGKIAIFLRSIGKANVF